MIENAEGDASSAGDFRHLTVGRNCYLGEEVHLDLANRIMIADDAVVSGRVALLTHADCSRSPALAALFPRRCEPITVGRGSWLGFGATLLAGCTVGAEAVVAAGALLTGPAAPRTLYAGVPARALRELGNEPAAGRSPGGAPQPL